MISIHELCVKVRSTYGVGDMKASANSNTQVDNATARDEAIYRLIDVTVQLWDAEAVLADAALGEIDAEIARDRIGVLYEEARDRDCDKEAKNFFEAYADASLALFGFAESVRTAYWAYTELEKQVATADEEFRRTEYPREVAIYDAMLAVEAFGIHLAAD